MKKFQLSLKMPLRLALKIYRRIKIEIIELIKPREKRYLELKQSYALVGLSTERDRSVEILNNCLKNLGLDRYDESNGMYSEHLVIFAAISASNFKPKKILEIGTYDGKTSRILNSLFPYSSITTIDLKDEDPIFRFAYNQGDHIESFIKRRNLLINNQKNINFIQANSLHLTLSKDLDNQDLIWVDGAHGYPIVTSDITNCIRILKKGGVLMCDDVWKKIKVSDSLYSSIASFQTLSSYEKANIINTVYFHKRIGKRYNGHYKFVSFSKLVDNFQSEIN